MKYLKEQLSLHENLPGFTLVEVVVVMAIIGSLVMAILPSVELAMNRSADTQLKTHLTMIAGAGHIYKLEHGKFPESIQTLVTEGFLPAKDYSGIEYDGNKGVASGKASNGKTIASGNVTS